MKEQEFDIYVRNLLKDAEAPVSPAVWEGVSAGLRKKRNIVFLRRVSAAVAAAAAIAVAAVLFRPSVPSAENHSLPTTILAAGPSADAPRKALPAAPVRERSIEEQISGTEERTARVVPLVAEAPAAALTQVSDPAPATVREDVPSVSPDLPRATVEDRKAMERLALQEDRRDLRGFSFSAAGNLQTRHRGWSNSSHTVPLRYGAAPDIDETKEQIVFQNSETFFIPVSVGIKAMYNFSSRWAVSTGVTYTFMGRNYKGQYVSGQGWNSILADETVIDNHQHWVGIPVDAYFTFLNQGRLRAHIFAGGAVDFLIKNDNLVHDPMGTGTDVHFIENSAVPQWSAGAGIGLEFRLTPHVSLYLDPQLRYYFATNPVQPRSLRTVQPFRFDVEGGLRFNLGK